MNKNHYKKYFCMTMNKINMYNDIVLPFYNNNALET